MPGLDVKIKIMEEKDIDRVWSLYLGDDGFYREFSTDERVEQARNFLKHIKARVESNRGLVAICTGNIQGFATYCFNTDYISLVDLLVNKQLNGYGIGKKLVAGVAQKSLAQGINRMSLQLPIKGENEARQFYLSLRFREGRNYLMYHNNLKKLSKQNPVILNPGDYACRTCKDLEVSFSTPWRISISNICDLCKDFSIV